MISPILQTDLHLGLVMGIARGWHGIVCHNITGHVIELNPRSFSFQEYYDAFHDRDYGRHLLSGKINPSLLNLKRLVRLDLSNNDFGGTHIPKFLGSPGSLKYLNLSRARIWRAFDWLELINNALPSLVRLHLSYVNFLRFLHLSMSTFRNLIRLGIDSILRYPTRLYGFSRLELLNLGFNNLQGEVSSAIENMTSLIGLHLSSNDELEFNRGILASFKNLCNLKVLSFSSLKLKQDIAEVFEIR
ncbi:unnamed protein product [Dovyalis caffra]|uniref:Uncharacterized protein n=1 Tax=Dovyalis caffra TaxID=77055 RepID=A0AAV1RHR4_9ROSI|nr:unnamed protein product [Dovyalis caffra]